MLSKIHAYCDWISIRLEVLSALTMMVSIRIRELVARISNCRNWVLIVSVQDEILCTICFLCYQKEILLLLLHHSARIFH